MLSSRCRCSLIWNGSTPEWIYPWTPNVKSIKIRLQSKRSLLPRKAINNSKKITAIFASLVLSKFSRWGIKFMRTFLHHYTLIGHNTLSIWCKMGNGKFLVPLNNIFGLLPSCSIWLEPKVEGPCIPPPPPHNPWENRKRKPSDRRFMGWGARALQALGKEGEEEIKMAAK